MPQHITTLEIDVTGAVSGKVLKHDGTKFVPQDDGGGGGGGTIDAIPTDGSPNAVSSNGVFDALTPKIERASTSPVAVAKVWAGSQTEFDAIATKDTTTLYFIQ